MARHYEEKRDESGRIESRYQEALEANYGDYAYGPGGEMIAREKDGTYTVASGWEADEATGIPASEIGTTLKKMGIPRDGWNYE